MASLEKLGEAMAQVMRAKRYPVERLAKKAPRGFWGAVKEICGDPRERMVSCLTIGSGNQTELTEIVKRHLEDDRLITLITCHDTRQSPAL